MKQHHVVNESIIQEPDGRSSPVSNKTVINDIGNIDDKEGATKLLPHNLAATSKQNMDINIGGTLAVEIKSQSETLYTENTFTNLGGNDYKADGNEEAEGASEYCSEEKINIEGSALSNVKNGEINEVQNR